AFAHLGAVAVKDQRDVRIGGRGGTEGIEKGNVLPGVGEMILATEDVGHFHLDVIHHVYKVEDVAAVRAAHGHVRLLGGGKGHIAADHVMDGDGSAAELESYRAIFLHIGAASGLQL